MESQTAAFVCATLLSVSSQAAEPAGSDTLAFDVGGNRSLHVSLKDGQLEVREVGGFGPNQGHVFRSQVLTPTPAQWAELWAAVEQLGVWKWKTVYRSERSSQMDGVKWSLELAHAGKRLNAAGYNATPDAWPAFQAAVQKLAGDPTAH